MSGEEGMIKAGGKISAIFLGFLIGCFCQEAMSLDVVVDGKKITFVAVNGGADSSNPGTSCFLLSGGVSEKCAGGYIAIRNNNSQLISSVLQAKATGADVWVYYEDSSPVQHCPGIVFTTCAAISVGVR